MIKEIIKISLQNIYVCIEKIDILLSSNDFLNLLSLRLDILENSRCDISLLFTTDKRDENNFCLIY